jgi:hypothetical protein
MRRSVEGTLCLHGAIVMFAAFVSGGMIAAAAMGQVSGSVEDWKLAHMEPLINGIVLFAVAGCIGKLALSSGQTRVITYCLVIMAYCNTVFGFMRGLTGALGYQFDDSLANNIATFSGMLGVPLAFVAFSLIFLGAIRAGRTD